MKILFVQELFPPDVTGGGETLTLRTIQELIKRGHSVKVICTGNPKTKHYKGIQTIRIPINRYLMNLSVATIAKHAKEVDLIHTSSGNSCLPSWVAGKLIKKPVLCYVHHAFGPVWNDVRGKILGSVFQLLEQLFLTRSYDAVVFQNKLTESFGINMGIDRKRIYRVQPGIEYEKFQMKNVKKESFVLFVGNLAMDKPMVKIKGMEYLIESARILFDTKFVIVGKGNYLNIIKENSPPNVEFTGSLFGRDLIKLYNKASIFCFPSLAEGFGLALLEAMATGCGIISTVDIGQKGIAVRPKNTLNIVNAIRTYQKNKVRLKKDVVINKKIIKKFTWDTYFDKLTKIYELITNKG